MTSNSVQSPSSLGQRFLLIEVQHPWTIPREWPPSMPIQHLGTEHKWSIRALTRVGLSVWLDPRFRDHGATGQPPDSCHNAAKIGVKKLGFEYPSLNSVAFATRERLGPASTSGSMVEAYIYE